MGKETVVHKKLKALIKKLSSIRGRHTELISIYVPKDSNLNIVSNQVTQEQGTAANIKSKTVRKNVTGALEKITQQLKLYKRTPPNGLAIFCGNTSEKEGESDLELWMIEPPEPLNQRLYRCDQQFVTDPLRHMVREKEVYILVVMDKSEADIGALKGKAIENLKHLDSLVPGKTKKGGWSQARYARVREGLLNDHMKKTGEITTSFVRDMPDLKGIIIGGPGPIKDMFHKGDFLPTDVKSKVIGVVDTSYTGDYGLKEMLTRGEDLLSEASVTKERKLLERFFSELSKDSGLAVYGQLETVKALEMGAVETLLISESLDWVQAKLSCPACKNKIEKAVKSEKKHSVECPKCGTVMEVENEEDALEKLEETADNVNSVVEIISTDTMEGNQLQEMGGIAGILRYKI